MDLNVDLDARIVGDPDQIERSSSQMAGVDRRMRDGVGGKAVTFNDVATGVALHASSAIGIEKMMVAGSRTEGRGSLGLGTWLPSREGATLEAIAGLNGAKVWMNIVHLSHTMPSLV